MKLYIFSFITLYLFASAFAATRKHHLDPILRLESQIGKDGDYKYGYQSPVQARDEIRGNDGKTKGYYTYIDDDDQEQYVSYLADENGYRVDGSVLGETPEVAAARKAHEEAFRKALARPRSYVAEALQLAPEPKVLSRQKSLLTAPVTTLNPERIDLLENKEPCHGPLCNAKYYEVQKTVHPDHASKDHVFHNYDASFLRKSVDPNIYRVQLPENSEEARRQAFLNAARSLNYFNN